MQGMFIGHLSIYNKNQIRDKLLLVLIFFAQVRWQSGKVMVLDKKTVLHAKECRGCCIMCEYYDVCRNDGTLE